MATLDTFWTFFLEPPSQNTACCYEEVWLFTTVCTVSTFVILRKHKSAVCSTKKKEKIP